MMRKFFILLTLTMFTFVVGHAQFDVKTQQGYDAQLEEIYGQPPVSEDLQSCPIFSSSMKGNRTLDGLTGYGSLIPKVGSYAGKLYSINFGDGTVTRLKNYYAYYFTSAEYVNGTVYVYLNDLDEGFGTIDFANGTYEFTQIKAVRRNMTDMTYNHNNGKMYGLSYGLIYEVNLTDGTATPVTVPTGTPKFIAIACDTYGNMFAVTASTTANAKLYKFTECKFSEGASCINSDLGYKSQYTQTMAYNHNTDQLIWCQGNGGRTFVEINPKTGDVLDTQTTTSTIGGLFFPYNSEAQSITVVQPEGQTATVAADHTSAKKGTTIVVSVNPVNCNTITKVHVEAKEASLLNTDLTSADSIVEGVSYYHFLMPASEVTVTTTIQDNPTISNVTIALGEDETGYACYGSTVTLTATATTDGTISSYEWYNGETFKASSTTNTIEVQESGNWTVEAMTNYGCTALSSNAVTVTIDSYEVPTPAISGNTQVCSGDDNTLTVEGTFAGGETFTWKEGENILGTGNSYTFGKVTVGKSNITVTATRTFNGLSCEKTSAEFGFTVNPLPVVSITAVPDKHIICNGGSITLSVNFDAEEYSFAWTKGEVTLTETSNSLTISNATTDNSGTYSVKVTNKATGCYASADFELTVHAVIGTPTVTLSDESICQNAAVTFTANTDGAAQYTYVWFDNETPIDTTTDNPAVYENYEATPGSHNIKVKIIDGECFQESDSKVLTVIAMPQTSITKWNGSDLAEGEHVKACASINEDEITEIEATASEVEGASSYTWYVGETTVGTGLTANIPVPTEAGTYTLKVVAATEGGCSGIGLRTFDVLPRPALELVQTVDQHKDEIQACYGGKFTINVKERIENCTYQWYFEGKAIENATDTVYSKDNLDEDTDAGYYSVIATNTETGCTSEVGISVNVLAPADGPNIAGPDAPICYGSSTKLNYDYALNVEDFIFEWYKGEELIATKPGAVYDEEQEMYVEADVSIETGNLKENTTFTLKARHIWSEPESNCTVAGEPFTVEVKPNTPVNIIATDENETELISVEGHFNSCFENPFMLIAEEGFESYQWYLIGKDDTTSLSEGKMYLEEELVEKDTTLTYMVVASDDKECDFIGNVTVKINALPEFEITNKDGETLTELTLCVGDSATVKVRPAKEYDSDFSYVWNVIPKIGIVPSDTIGDTFKFYAKSQSSDESFTIKVSGTSSVTNCVNSTFINAVVNPIPVVAISSPEAKEYDMIADRKLTLSGTVDGGTEKVGKFYLDGDTEPYKGNTIDLFTLEAGEHTVTYTYSYETTSCESSATVTFTVVKKYWSDADIREGEWYSGAASTTNYNITSEQEFGFFLYLIETGTTFEGKTITINRNMNFAGRFFKAVTGFKGTLEGYGKTFSNVTILEPVDGEIVNGGTVRNLGIKDSNFNLMANSGDVTLKNNGNISNSYITKTVFSMTGENNFAIQNVEGAFIQNFYLCGDSVYDQKPISITNNGVIDRVYSNPAISYGGLTIPSVESDEKLLDTLNYWVDFVNTSDYMDWVADTKNVNDGHPIHDRTFHMVHNVVELAHVFGGTGSIVRHQGVPEEDPVIVNGKEKGFPGDHTTIDTTIFGFAQDTVTLTVKPDFYQNLKSVNVVTKHGVEVESYDMGGYTYFCMPFDSLTINVKIGKDYWTDGDIADFSWYQKVTGEEGVQANRFEIGTAEQLAGLARIVNNINLEGNVPDSIKNGYDFENQEIHIVGNIDLKGHVWNPIDGFNGYIEGYGKYIENMYSVDDAAALFANLGNKAKVRNIGIRDAYVETTSEAETVNTYYSENFDSYENNVYMIDHGWTKTNKAMVYTNSHHLVMGFNCDESPSTVQSALFDLSSCTQKVNISFDVGQTYNYNGNNINVSVTDGASTLSLGVATATGSYQRFNFVLDDEDYFKKEIRLAFSDADVPSVSGAYFIDNIVVKDVPSGNGGGAAFAVNNAGQIFNCYAHNVDFEGVTANCAAAVANNTGKVENVYVGKHDAEKFFLNNNGISTDNHIDANSPSSETGVTSFTEAGTEDLMNQLNTWVVKSEDHDNYIWIRGDELGSYPYHSKVRSYFISYTETEHGSASGVLFSPVNETITVTTTADKGFELGLLTYSYTDPDDGPVTETITATKQFVMPNADVKVYATFTKIDYAITYVNGANGEVTGPATANNDSIVKLTVTPNTGYEINTFEYLPVDSTSRIAVVDNQFKMTACAVTVYSTFKKHYYDITYSPKQEEVEEYHGYISGVEKDTLGATVVVNVVPSTGYDLETLKYTTDGENYTDITKIDDKYSFEMPAANVSIVATFVLHVYDVLYAKVEKGTVTGASTAKMGEEVKLTVTPDTDMELWEIKFYDTKQETVLPGFDFDWNDSTFIMQASDVKLVPTFGGHAWAITYTNDGFGHMEGPAKAVFNDKVDLTDKPNTGYQLDVLTVKDENGNPVAVEGEYQFTMPNMPVTVDAKYTPINYVISYSPSKMSEGKNGYIYIEEGSAHYGDSISVTVTPAEGYKLDAITGVETYNYATNKFKMPAENVNIVASFTKADYLISKDSENGSFEVPATSQFGDVVNVTGITPNEGYELNNMYYIAEGSAQQVAITDNTFNMPANNITVYVVFTKINYPITYTPAQGESVEGYISGNATGQIGDVINVTVTELEGYELETLTANNVDIKETKQFTVGTEAVNVVATFAPKSYSIAVASGIEHGKVTTDPESTQHFGYTVTITTDPDDKYVLDVLTVKMDGTEQYVEVTGIGNDQYQFTMPANNVTIDATFKDGFWSDAGIRDLDWYINNPNATEYTFTTPAELGGLSYLVNGYDKGNTDDPQGPVSFKGVTFTLESENGVFDMHEFKWRPIGGQVNTTWYFEGEINGNNSLIKDLYVVEPKGSYQAFVGLNKGIIHDIYVTGEAEGKYWVAGIAGRNDGTIYNCSSDVAITTLYEAGGIVGSNNGKVLNCYFRGTIENTQASFGKAALNVGGIVATNQKNGVIENVYNASMSIKGTGNNPGCYFGGIAGQNITKANIKDAYWLYEVLKDIHGYDSIIGMKKGCGKGYIDASCNPFTQAFGMSKDEETGLKAVLDAYVDDYNQEDKGHKEELAGWWVDNKLKYKYPILLLEWQYMEKDPEKNGEEITDIEENSVNFNLYPNPAKEYVRIECEGITRITVVNMLGQVVINQNYDTDNVMLHVNGMTPGVYTVNVVTVNGSFTRNLVVTR